MQKKCRKLTAFPEMISFIFMSKKIKFRWVTLQHSFKLARLFKRDFQEIICQVYV